jgi:cytochrome c553
MMVVRRGAGRRVRTKDGQVLAILAKQVDDIAVINSPLGSPRLPQGRPCPARITAGLRTSNGQGAEERIGRAGPTNKDNSQLVTEQTKKSMKKMLTLIAALCVAVAFTAKAADVKENYKTHCTKCHGEDGKGETKMGKKSGCKDYTDAKVQAEMKDDKAFKSLKEGQKDGDKELMKPFADKLSDDEIKALIAHMRTFKK